MIKKKGFFTIFFLVILMFVKISSFHVFAHGDTDEDAIENCELCKFTIVNQHTDYVLNSETNFVQPKVQVPQSAVKVSYVNPFLDTSSATLRLFTRPPPIFI